MLCDHIVVGQSLGGDWAVAAESALLCIVAKLIRKRMGEDAAPFAAKRELLSVGRAFVASLLRSQKKIRI